jgi:hypothetical protein
MKFKPTVILATFVVTMGLLLGASTAQAAEVFLEGDSVIRIENLEVFNEITEETILYNVDFVYDTAINVYGENLDYDFPIAGNATSARTAVLNALNANNPIPGGAGPQSSERFHIGNMNSVGRVIAFAGEKTAEVWQECTTNDCLLAGTDGKRGVAVLDPDDPFTYADFTPAQGATPGSATLISPQFNITESNPTYTWKAVENSSLYFLWIEPADGDEMIFVDVYSAEEVNCGGGTGECSVTPETVLAYGSYTWQILTANSFGIGRQSDWLLFSVVENLPPGPTVFLEGDSVIRIENQPLNNRTNGTSTYYNVDFVFDSAVGVYGENLDFDFTFTDEDLFQASDAVQRTLSNNSTVPLGAGPYGVPQFIIGGAVADNVVVVAGSANYTGKFWSDCGNQSGCMNGIKVVYRNDLFTYAKFTEVPQ